MGAVAKAEVFWRAALQGIRHQPFPHAVAVLTLAISLFALGLGTACSTAIDRVLGSLGSDVQVTVWLRPEAPVAEVDTLVSLLRERSFVRGKYIDAVAMGALRADYEQRRASRG